jgi:DNA-binding GntR family transcriptional regulator
MNHNTATPLYLQLRDELKKSIQEGTLANGERLPSERELCNQYSVSRITVRQALNELEKSGLIYTVQGKGTFVHVPLLNQGLLKVISFGQSLHEKGIEGFTEVLEYEDPAEDFEASYALCGKQEQKIVRLTLRGFASGEPVVLYSAFFRQDVGTEMHRVATEMAMEMQPFSTFDLYNGIGIQIGRIDQQIKALNADKKLAALLKIKPGDALLELESIIFEKDDMPVEYKRGFYRSDKYSFNVKREL